MAQHLTPEPAEIPIPARVGRDALPMLRTIHLHDQPERRCEEIRDGIPKHDLAPEADAELPSGELPPECGFRLRGCAAVHRSASSEHVFERERLSEGA